MWMIIGSTNATDTSVNRKKKQPKQRRRIENKKPTQEWNLIKWNCVTCVLIAFLSFDRDFNEDFLFFLHSLLALFFFSSVRFLHLLDSFSSSRYLFVIVATVLFDGCCVRVFFLLLLPYSLSINAGMLSTCHCHATRSLIR